MKKKDVVELILGVVLLAVRLILGAVLKTETCWLILIEMSGLALVALATVAGIRWILQKSTYRNIVMLVLGIVSLIAGFLVVFLLRIEPWWVIFIILIGMGLILSILRSL